MPQFSVDSRTIDNVIGYINNGQISIPEIQRPFVWDGSKIRDLIDSLYNGFPVGYLIVWQNPNMKDKQGNLTSDKMIMIDGQQRVTAIMTALVGMKVLGSQRDSPRVRLDYGNIKRVSMQRLWLYHNRHKERSKESEVFDSFMIHSKYKPCGLKWHCFSPLFLYRLSLAPCLDNPL